MQRLYEVAKEFVLKGRAPNAQEVQQLCAVIEQVPLEDLGLEDETYGAPIGDRRPSLASYASGAAAAAASPSGSPVGADALSSASSSNSPRGNPSPPPEAEPAASWGQYGSKRPYVTYLDIHEDREMTIGVFCLPAGTSIPLHNHPGMTVFSRLLYGTMHIRAYDLLPGEDHAMHGNGLPKPLKRARLVTDTTLTAPAPTSVLFPTHSGNIHAFRALTPCAVLDVLTPPYAAGDARDCQYFREHLPEGVHEEGGRLRLQAPPAGGEPLVVGLEDVDCPADFHVLRGKYRGRRVNA